MIKSIVRLSALALFAFSLSLTSCSKEGSTGPAGPAGPTGATGATGAKGETGTANVIYSDWLDVTFNDTTGVADVAAPSLTLDVLNKGSIKVYWNLSDETDPFIVSVPAVISPYLLFSAETLAQMWPSITDGNYPEIYVDAYYSEKLINLVSNYPVSSSEGFSQFRYIIIPGGVQEGNRSAIDWKDYNSVKKYYQLKD
ncbi:MAG TPA: collagen-like protein [Flavihumibacter sp.]|nr:collagen-like protein [Bacteroidota bacterium]HOA39329.1 collagen-like protein [Flavihumibacter sp.]HPZ88248.1 collagen-like protein [Flavihumibacter sp.]HQD10590.1 collagen-like protein [Flavihumibacter sp.]